MIGERELAEGEQQVSLKYILLNSSPNGIVTIIWKQRLLLYGLTERNTEVKMAKVRVVHAQYMCLERRGLLTRVGRIPAPAMMVK